MRSEKKQTRTSTRTDTIDLIRGSYKSQKEIWVFLFEAITRNTRTQKRIKIITTRSNLRQWSKLLNGYIAITVIQIKNGRRLWIASYNDKKEVDVEYYKKSGKDTWRLQGKAPCKNLYEAVNGFGKINIQKQGQEKELRGIFTFLIP